MPAKNTEVSQLRYLWFLFTTKSVFPSLTVIVFFSEQKGFLLLTSLP